MKLCTVTSALIISKRTFAFIKGYISSDTIDYLLCNQCEVNLSEKDTNKVNGPQFIWLYILLEYSICKDIRNHYYYEFIWKLVPL